MAYSKVNNIPAASIAKVNNVPVATIAKVNNVAAPVTSSEATIWVAVAQHGQVGYAANSDRTAWTSYDNTDLTGTPAGFDIAYGKNSAGAGIFICTRDSATREIQVSGTDPTSAGDWTAVDLEGNSGIDQFCVRWGAASNAAAAGTWVAIGAQSGEKLYRSTDGGGSFSSVDLSGLANHSATGITGLACSDTAGTWAFGQAGRFYISTDDAASWAVSNPWAGDNAPTHIFGICFTNSSWVIAYKRGGSALRFRSCAASDITDWGSEYSASGNALIPDTAPPKRVSMAAADGRVCLIGTSDDCFTYFDVAGKVISNIGEDNKSTSDDINGLCTDGTTWIAVAEDGDVWESSDGAAWALTVNGHTFPDTHTNDDWESVAPNVVLPL